MPLAFLHIGSGNQADSEALHFPLAEPARIAVLGGGFRAARNIRDFSPDHEPAALLTWRPEALVASLPALLSLAERQAALPDLAVLVAITTVGAETVSDGHRDYLWSAFGVPVFEQLRGRSGSIVARECEVHDGLHIEHHAIRSELDSRHVRFEVETAHCECGSETPRLRNLRPVKVAAAA